ncbi:hypothetical protein BDQ17DRAFT_1336041 [Cyathus striatus]|nr:hypothetical protein BDQ17DRAFT_1336041 [Cyathus striatus]
MSAILSNFSATTLSTVVFRILLYLLRGHLNHARTPHSSHYQPPTDSTYHPSTIRAHPPTPASWACKGCSETLLVTGANTTQRECVLLLGVGNGDGDLTYDYEEDIEVDLYQFPENSTSASATIHYSILAKHAGRKRVGDSLSLVEVAVQKSVGAFSLNWVEHCVYSRSEPIARVWTQGGSWVYLFSWGTALVGGCGAHRLRDEGCKSRRKGPNTPISTTTFFGYATVEDRWGHDALMQNVLKRRV